MSSNPFSSRMPLRQLRVVAAIYGGRVEVRPATSPRDHATYILRGRGCILPLLAHNDGTVDAELVWSWCGQVAGWDARALPQDPAPPP